jgi:RNA-directed DNA polymerase
MFAHANVDAESTGRSCDPQPPMSLSGNAQKWTLSTMTMEEICLYANLMQAAQHVLANKGAAGPDGLSVDDVARNLDVVLRNLQHKLLDGSYRPGAVRRVFIPKTDGTRRGLGIPNVVDRIVQQAIHRVLSPHFEQKFHDASHGFRPGRSCHTAIAQAEAILGDGASHVVDIDLAKFFDTVNHDRLMSQLAKEIDDKRLLKLLRALLSTGVVMSTGVVVKMREGTPQGGPLSPLLSNVVLNELDWELEKRGHRFVRYADDCNIYVDSERAAQRVMASITVFIEKRLRLKVNQKKSTVGDPSTRHFLGFTLSHGEKKNQ